jgi:hypothetical protein
MWMSVKFGKIGKENEDRSLRYIYRSLHSNGWKAISNGTVINL